MKTIIASAILLLSAYSFAQTTVISEKTCVRESFSGLERSLVNELGETFKFETGIDSEGFGIMAITYQDGTKRVLDYAGEHGRQSAIGPTFAAGGYFGTIYPNLGFRTNLRIEVGEGEHEGTLTAKRDATCRGGYIGGCSGFANATYQCN